MSWAGNGKISRIPCSQSSSRHCSYTDQQAWKTSKHYNVNFTHIMPPSAMPPVNNRSRNHTSGFNDTIPPRTTAVTEDTSVVNEAISVFMLPGIIILYFLEIAMSFFVLAVMACFHLPISIRCILDKTLFGEKLQTAKAADAAASEDTWCGTIAGLTCFNSIILTVGSMWSAFYAGLFSNMGFLESMWHGLGVGATVTGLLLMVELVVIALCCYIADAGEKKQESVKVRTFVDSATQS